MNTRDPIFQPTEKLTVAQLEARSRYLLGNADCARQGRFFADAEGWTAKSEEYAALAKVKSA